MKIIINNEKCIPFVDFAKAQHKKLFGPFKNFYVEEVLIEIFPNLIRLLYLGVTGNFVTRPRTFSLLEQPINKETTTTTIDGTTVTVDKALHVTGNLDWWNGDNDFPTVLTWKGPLGRLVPFDISKEIQGFTTGDSLETDLTSTYTCFSPYIWSSGELLTTFPYGGDLTAKVLGCAIQNDKLVVIVNNHYSDRSGFFEQIWVATNSYKDWLQLYERQTSRPTVAWFFNQSGTRATQGNFEYSIDVESKIVTLETYPTGSGQYVASQTQNGTTVENNIIHVGEWVVFSDYKQDTRVTASVKLDDRVEQNVNINVDETTEIVDVYFQGTQSYTPFIIVKSRPVGGDVETIAVGDRFAVQGGYTPSCPLNPVEFTCAGVVFSGGTVIAITGCGSATLTATQTSTTGGSSLVATQVVRKPVGTWQLVATDNSFSLSATVITGLGGTACYPDCNNPNCGSHYRTRADGSFSTATFGCDLYTSFLYYGTVFPYGIKSTEYITGGTKVITEWTQKMIGEGTLSRVSLCSDCGVVRSFGTITGYNEPAPST